MNRSLLLAITLSLGTLTSACARAGTLVDLGVTDLDSGARLKVHRAGGKFYIAGDPGHRYAVTLKNRTGARVMTVLSVDGVNAVTGATASPLQSGYVLGPYENAEIRGWRKNMAESAEFVFTSVPRSYAAKTGRPQNVGVIGVAVFREAAPRPVEPYWQDEYERDDVAAAESADSRESLDRYESNQRDEGYAGNAAKAQAAAPAPVTGQSAPGARAEGYRADSALAAEKRVRQQLGTGHGQRRYDPIGTTEFQRRSDSPDEIVTLHYDDWSGLAARGVVRERWQRREPNPFPMAFVPDPPR